MEVNKMARVRMQNTPEDFKRLGVSQDKFELWEDGLREDFRQGTYEWWYFDAIMDDGSKVVIHFNTKDLRTMHDNACHPTTTIKITTPDGISTEKQYEYTSDEFSYSKEQCDVKCGPHSFIGNLREYTIKVSPIEGLGADLKLSSLSQPWRPGTGYFAFGDNDEQYFTWLCVVPKGKVSGNITVNGKTIEVQGYGYHDHQWGCINPLMAWNTWLWARLDLEDYSMLVFDFVAAKEYGFTRFPLTFIQDKDGNLIFENTDSNNVKYEVFEEYKQEGTNKYYPKISKYIFENEGKKVECTLNALDELEIQDQYTNAPEAVKKNFDMLEKQPTYARYFASDEVIITEGNQSIERSGNLIYEFVYVGKSYKEHV
jgi:Predicted secreted hydrolase